MLNSTQALILLSVASTSFALASSDMQRIKCHLLNDEYQTTKASFNLESPVRRTVDGRRYNQSDIQNLSRITSNGLKFITSAGIDTSSFDEDDSVYFITSKRPGMEQSDNYPESYQISGFNVQFQGSDRPYKELYISSSFNYGKKIPALATVTKNMRYFNRMNPNKVKETFEKHLIDNEIAGYISLRVEDNKPAKRLIQCQSLSSNLIYEEGANH